MFKEVSQHVDFPALETDILKFWKQRSIYEKSLQRREGGPRFVFYEGPPTANGLPHPGHCLTRAIKDVFPRYRTMRGYYCERKAGWDTHGLPVEVEVCKDLGIHSKEEIEAYGVEPFVQLCQQSVWRYMQQWERLTERLGFWIHLDEAYVTYHQSYVESVWWSLRNLFERGLLYQGHKIVWWWAQGGTALSSGEVGEGYREVADPSVYVRFPLLDAAGNRDGTDLLVWTTTPWTLSSNQYAAVHPDLEYATVVDDQTGQRLLMASALVETIGEKVKGELHPVAICRGADLIGRQYVPPFDFYWARDGRETGQLVEGGRQPLAWRIVPADFVTTGSGTGIVHQAPAFGEVDYEVLLQEQARFAAGDGPRLICAVGPDGKFTAEAPPYDGRWVKDCDKEITRNLRERGLLFHHEQYVHDYPFCWRAEEDPLIQYPRRSWFIRTTQFKDEMLANNWEINWLPEHIRDGRFGNFLQTNVDWALSRERYWGTPLPIWVCDVTGQMQAIDSYAELLDKPGVAGTEYWDSAKRDNPDLPEHLKVHKPYIDAVTYQSPFADNARMRRVPEVIDCWYDAGAMPFAQWGYPQTGAADFEAQFPADFISEALDQTRGWFYSLLAISTLLFGEHPAPGRSAAASSQAPTTAPKQVTSGSHATRDAVTRPHPYPHPFRNCIVLGLMLSEWWENADGGIFLSEQEAQTAAGQKCKQVVGKMSKRKRNYREPQEIFDKYGADALRWYLFANQAPWTSIRYSERAIKDSIPEFLLRLWNVYSFFVIYGNIDGFDPSAAITGQAGELSRDVLLSAATCRPVRERPELDRWILSELQHTVGEVVARMDAYDNFAACGQLYAFVDALSNWYVRRSRDRFWSEDQSAPDKLDAYWTLYDCLLTLTKLTAPFTPFLAETLWQNLAGVFGDRVVESVHLCDYPTPDESCLDGQLSEQMSVAREISSLGRSARMNAKLKVRQPLSKVEVILAQEDQLPWLQAHADLIRHELNVMQVEFTQEAEEYISYKIQPNFKRLGPRLGKLMPAAKQALAQADGGQLLHDLQQQGKIALRLHGESVELDADDIQVALQAKEGWAAAQGRRCVVVLSTEITDELRRKGHARDIVRFIQERRKELNCDYTARIHVGLQTDNQELRAAIAENREYIMQETLAVELELAQTAGGTAVEVAIADATVNLYVTVV